MRTKEKGAEINGHERGRLSIMALLCKADEVLVVGVHVGQLAVDVHHDLLLALLLLLSDENAVILPSAFLFGKQVESWDFSFNHP